MTEANGRTEASGEPGVTGEGVPTLDEVIEPELDLPPTHRPRMHGGMPLRPDDDALDLAVQRDRVAAGVADYSPDDVPPATEQVPEGASEAAELAQQGLLDDDSA